MDWNKVDNLLGEIQAQISNMQHMARLLKTGQVAEETLTVEQVASIAARSKARVQAFLATVDSLKQELDLP